MHRCPRCLTIVEVDDKFCDNCGLRLTQEVEKTSTDSGERAPSPILAPGICSACGSENVPGEMFCENCGVQLAPVASVPPPPPVRNSAVAPDPGNNISSQEVSADVVCLHCGKAHGLGSEFCQICGTQLPSPETVQVDFKGEQKDSAEIHFADPSQEVDLEPEPSRTDQITGKFILRGTEEVIELVLEKPELLIGRTDIARSVFPEIDLVPFGGDKFGVSRKHAQLVARGSQLFIQDLNSTNFTFINDQRLLPGEYYLINSGDEIRFGMMALKFQAE